MDTPACSSPAASAGRGRRVHQDPTPDVLLGAPRAWEDVGVCVPVEPVSQVGFCARVALPASDKGGGFPYQKLGRRASGRGWKGVTVVLASPPMVASETESGVSSAEIRPAFVLSSRS